jgi:hypothetical protein
VTAAAALALAMTVAVADGSDAPRPERLSFNVAADESVVEALRARLAPALAARNVELELTVLAAVDIERVFAAATTAVATSSERPSGAPLARVWLDGRDPRVAVLFLIPRQGERVLVRKVPLTGRFDAVALAEIAYIVERAVASLLAAEPIGVPPAEARAALAQPSAPPAVPAIVAPPAPAANVPAPRLALTGTVFAGAAAWASSASTVLDAGLSVGIERLSPALRVGLTLAVTGRRSFDVASSPAGVRVSGGDVRLLLTAGRMLGDGWGIVRLGIGPGLVIAHAEPIGAAADATEMVKAQPRTDADPILAALARWDFPVGRLARPFVAATVDVVPVRGEYTAVVNGTSRTLLAPWPVRPGLLAGIAFGR